MATTSTIWCILALSLTTWAAPAEEGLQVPAQVSAQLQIQPVAVKQPAEPIYVPGDRDQEVQPAVLLTNIPLEASAEQQAAAEGGAPLEGDLAASPDANPAEGDLETANSFWRGYGGWGYGGWGGYRPYYGGGWRHHGYGRGYGGWGGYRGGYGYWG